MDLVVVEALTDSNTYIPIFYLLVVETGLGQVRTVDSARCFIDRNKGGLHQNDSGGAVCVVRVGVLRDLKAVGNAVAIGINVQRVSTGVIGVYEGAGSSFDPVQQAVSV